MFGAVNDVSQEGYPLLCASDREGNGRRLCGTGLEATLKLPRDNLDGSVRQSATVFGVAWNGGRPGPRFRSRAVRLR